MSDFACTTCEYSTADLKEGVGHATSTNHELTRAIDDEGSTMTISVAPDEDLFDEDHDWEL